MSIERFEDIEAWKEARNIVNRVYSVCRVNGFSVKPNEPNYLNKRDNCNDLIKLDKP